MTATIRTVLGAVLVLLAAAAQAGEGELWFRKGERKTLARDIRDQGLACPEIKAVYLLGAKADGNHMRAVCGSKDGAGETFDVRLIVRASGSFRAEPWTETDPSFAATPSAVALTLRASLD
jgi:hypothetical protein